MLQFIVTLSLRFRGVVVALACMALAYGFWVATHAKLDVFPDFVPPQVSVQTEAPGLAPEQVETLVTRPVENAINGLGNQESLRSESIQGLSVITLVFKDGTNVQAARQMLAEKLAELSGQLPSGVRPPKMSPLVSSTMDLLKVGLLSETKSPMELRSFADWTLKPRLLSVAGVAKCSVFGGEVRQMQIRIDPERLIERELSITDVLNAARSATGVRGGGFIETRNQRIVLQTEGQLLTPEEIGDVVVVTSASGAPVRLKDVATVADGPQPKVGDAVVMGKPGVLLTMSSQFGANTMEVTKRLEAALDEMKPLFEREGITLYPRLHRPASFIEVSLGHIRNSLLLGAGLVALILFLFLGHVRTALISLAAIPLSLLSAMVVMEHLGVSLNTITLGGLAIALGEVVDDAIIDVENIVRRLRENRTLAKPRAASVVVLAASLEVRSAVVYATLIVICVFIPVLTLTGLQGSFFAPLAQAYILAILASLLTALTLTPALTLLFFARHSQQTSAPRLQIVLRGVYETLLRKVARRPWLMILAAVVFVALAISRVPTLGGTFLPEFREGHFVLGVSTIPGASIEETARIGTQISKALLANPHIATVEQQIGRAELGEDTWGPHKSEFHVELKPLKSSEEKGVEDDIRAILSSVPGIQFEILTFLGDRIGESISGETSPVVVNVFGDQLDVIDQTANEVAQVLRSVPGSAEVEVKAPPGAPRLAVRLKPAELTNFGLRATDVLDAVQTAYDGAIVGQIFRENEVNDIAVTLDEKARGDPENVGALLISTPTGQRVPLRALADIYRTEGRYSILHEGARRRQTITCNPTRDVQSFVADVRRAVAEEVKLPEGVYLEYAGAAEAEAAATRELLVHSAIAAVGILLLLTIVLSHWRNVMLVLFNLPFALAGGVLIIYLARVLGAESAGALTMGSLVGFVTLFGVTTRNAIMLLSHYEHLVQREGADWNVATAIRGASERLVPILMTAAVTALGLLPLALHSGEAGCEIEGPMAVVILGGLLTSTTLNLLVLPSLALRWAVWKPAESALPLSADVAEPS
ncbi:MAG TPA: efflux RND transporter permease subunit [Opitutaceae bacterium]|nr:efflux RND transporter permease subunit [Opitutaceae bacterium]